MAGARSTQSGLARLAAPKVPTLLWPQIQANEIRRLKMVGGSGTGPDTAPGDLDVGCLNISANRRVMSPIEAKWMSCRASSGELGMRPR
jgi:hypothetical protein